jgi:hypothetical protein
VGQISSGVGVLDKAVAILEATVEGASLAELVERSGLPRATAHRLAQALEVHRLLIRDAQGRWRPGPRLAEFANAAPDVLLTAAAPVLAALRDQTGESAQLYLRRADERICVAAAERSSGLRDTVPIGAALPISAGSGAQVLLAWEPPEAVVTLLPRCRFTARTLAEVRRRGWAPTLWSRWGRDWRRNATATGIATRATQQLRGGDVVLLHDADFYSAPGSWRRTVAALPLILAEIEARGLRTVTL